MNPWSRCYWFPWLGMLLVWGCGPATQAMVHEEDCRNIFRWPRNSQRVIIRVVVSQRLTPAGRVSETGEQGESKRTHSRFDCAVLRGWA